MERVHRTSARVLPVNAAGEVLLLQFADPGRPADPPHWATVGGGLDAGETPAEAALRELWEETGIKVAAEDLMGPVHQEVHDYSWNGGDYRADSTYFATAVAGDVDVTFDNLEAAEIGYALKAAWWTPEGLRDDGTASSDEVADIMEIAINAVRGES